MHHFFFLFFLFFTLFCSFSNCVGGEAFESRLASQFLMRWHFGLALEWVTPATFTQCVVFSFHGQQLICWLSGFAFFHSERLCYFALMETWCQFFSRVFVLFLLCIELLRKFSFYRNKDKVQLAHIKTELADI